MASPEVEVVAQAAAVPGANNHEVSTTDFVHRQGVDEKEGSANYYLIGVNENYFSALGLQIIEGVNFNRKGNRDRVIINEKAVEKHAIARYVVK